MPLWKKVKKEKPAKTDSSVAYKRFDAASIDGSMVPRVDVAAAATKNSKNAKGREIGEKQHSVASVESEVPKWLIEWGNIRQDFESLCSQFSGLRLKEGAEKAKARQSEIYSFIIDKFDNVADLIPQISELGTVRKIKDEIMAIIDDGSLLFREITDQQDPEQIARQALGQENLLLAAYFK